MGLTASERQRRHRDRKRAERAAAERAARELAESQALSARIEAEAARQAALVDQAIASSGGVTEGALVERALAGSRELILAKLGNPLVRMAILAATPTRELAKQLGSASLVEVRKLQHLADQDLADRLFGKAPLALRTDGAPAVAIHLAMTPGLAAAAGIIVEDQRLEGGDGA